MSELIQPNVILPSGYEQARDILMDLWEVLRRYKAELFFRKEQRAMLLWVMEEGEKDVGGRYKVVALLHRLTPAGADYLKGIDPILRQNSVRPSNKSQVQDILKSMVQILSRHMATLVFDPAKEGMKLSVMGAGRLLGSGALCELAIVRNITRFGAELNSANFTVLRVPAPFDEADTLAAQRWLRGER